MRAKAPCAAIFDFWDDPCGYNYLLNKERTLIQLIRAGGDLGPNKCTLALVVRSSGLILAFLNPARDMQRSPPTRRAIANTARQHGAAVQSTGCTPYHILHTSNTHVVTRIHKSEAVRRGGGGHKESDRSEGQSTMTAVGPGASVIFSFTVAERKDGLQNGKESIEDSARTL